MKKFGVVDNLITWIKILNDQKSCVINEGFATQYLTSKKGAREGDPISAYLSIIALEVLFTLIKSEDNINNIDLYDYSFLFTAYADDSTFFLKNIASVRILVDTFKVFSCFPGLKPNINCWLGILKDHRTQSVVCKILI